MREQGNKGARGQGKRATERRSDEATKGEGEEARRGYRIVGRAPRTFAPRQSRRKNKGRKARRHGGTK